MSSVEMGINTSRVNRSLLLSAFCYVLMDQESTLDNRWKMSPSITRGSSEDHGPLHRKDAFTSRRSYSLI